MLYVYELAQPHDSISMHEHPHLIDSDNTICPKFLCQLSNPVSDLNRASMLAAGCNQTCGYKAHSSLYNIIGTSWCGRHSSYEHEYRLTCNWVLSRCTDRWRTQYKKRSASLQALDRDLWMTCKYYGRFSRDGWILT